jgi:hypothetical protein
LLLTLAIAASSIGANFSAQSLFLIGLVTASVLAFCSKTIGQHYWRGRERVKESQGRNANYLVGLPPQRDAFQQAFRELKSSGKKMINKYLIGFDLDIGSPLWLQDNELCNHACIISKNETDKTFWFESLILQQMARGRASGLTFIDSKPVAEGARSETLSHIIIMAMLTGRIEDLIVVDSIDPVHSYNFILTEQKADVKARKVLQASQWLYSSKSSNKEQDPLSADYVYRIVRALESLGFAWSIKDIATALSTFTLASSELRRLLNEIGAKQAMAELAQLETNYTTTKNASSADNINKKLSQIASELSLIAETELEQSLSSDLVLSDAISRGKIIYFRCPPSKVGSGVSQSAKSFQDDFEVSIKEINTARHCNLEDPHLIFIDENSPSIGTSWANLIDITSKARFPILFGAQSKVDLSKGSLGISEEYYSQVFSKVNFKLAIGGLEDCSLAQALELFTLKKEEDQNKEDPQSSVVDAPLEENIYDQIEDGFEEESAAKDSNLEANFDKDLAWFNFGAENVLKGRPLFLNAEVPDSLNVKEFIPRFEKQYIEEIGLAKWLKGQKEVGGKMPRA